MLRKIPLFIITIFILTSCDREKNIEFSPESFTEKDLAICQNGKCPEVTINYVEVLGDKQISQKINDKIKNFIFSSLLLGEDTIPTAKTIQEAAAYFIDGYYTDRKQFPDMAGEYFAEISVNQIYSTPEHLCFELRQYLFTGGAHGYGTTSFLNIDPQTGDQLSFDEIFKSRKDFKTFAEKKFRKQQQIPAGDSINATGFWFENEKFFLPETVGFTKDSLIFVYNQYDIASYADGPVELRIPTTEVKPFLKIQ